MERMRNLVVLNNGVQQCRCVEINGLLERVEFIELDRVKPKLNLDDRFKDERLQSLQFNSFSPEKREKLNSLRKLEAIFNFLREEVFEKLISVEFPKKLEEASSSFNFLQEERFNRVRLL